MTELIVPQPCFTTLIEKRQFENAACLKLVLSKILGYGIVVGSSLVKLPQVLKILLSGNVHGLSLSGILLELAGISFTAAYSFSLGYPFSTWGETLFLLIQNLMIGFLVINHRFSAMSALMFVLSFSPLIWYLSSGACPLLVLEVLQSFVIPCVVGAKVLQAYTNYTQGHTGQVSAITTFLLFLGGLARIFTSVQETNDKLVILTYCLSSIANGMLTFQMLYYWRVMPTPVKSKKIL